MYEDVLHDFHDVSSFNAELFNLVIARLGSLGYTVTETEHWNINYSIKKAEGYIKNFCNIQDIPEGLIITEVEIACGYFFEEKLSTGNLAGGMEIEEALKGVQLGDTNVTFADSDSAETKLKALIGVLLKHDEDLLCYRKLKW